MCIQHSLSFSLSVTTHRHTRARTQREREPEIKLPPSLLLLLRCVTRCVCVCALLFKKVACALLNFLKIFPSFRTRFLKKKTAKNWFVRDLQQNKRYAMIYVYERERDETRDWFLNDYSRRPLRATRARERRLLLLLLFFFI